MFADTEAVKPSAPSETGSPAPKWRPRFGDHIALRRDPSPGVRLRLSRRSLTPADDSAPGQPLHFEQECGAFARTPLP